MDQTSNQKKPRIAFVQASWHTDIVDQCWQGFQTELQRQGVAAETVSRYRVPGSFDIPLMAQELALTGRYDAIVAAGLIVDGGIYRHDFVSASVVDALMRVQLDTRVPVLSAVLTPHHFQEHKPHMDFFGEHFVLKGREAADACLKICANFAALTSMSRAA